MSRIFDRELKCGCLISTDGGGALIDCFSDDCKYPEWMKTEDFKKHNKEIREKNK